LIYGNTQFTTFVRLRAFFVPAATRKFWF